MLNYNSKIITFTVSGSKILEWEVMYRPKPVKIIYFILDIRLVGTIIFESIYTCLVCLWIGTLSFIDI